MKYVCLPHTSVYVVHMEILLQKNKTLLLFYDDAVTCMLGVAKSKCRVDIFRKYDT